MKKRFDTEGVRGRKVGEEVGCGKREEAAVSSRSVMFISWTF